ncbi:MAG: murein biosynthesis integral membrane protein MurJ [Polyangiaceae bacterium]
MPAHDRLSEPSRAAGEGERERERLLGRAAVVGAGTLISRVLGLLRDVTLAAVFDREATDAWWVAFTIPNALRSLLGEGAVTSTVVPLLSRKLEIDGELAARRFFARVRGASLVALGVVTSLGMLFARPLTELFAGGYRARPAEFERTVALTRAVFPYIFFMATAALGMAALNAKRRFTAAAFAPALLNVGLIACALTLPAAFAARHVDPVLVLAVGALAGGALQVLAQVPSLRAIGYASSPQFKVDADVRLVLRRLVPLTFGIGVYYIDLVLSRRLLSGLGPGAQSYFSWAMRLCDFPQGIFVMALSTAALPSLSILAAKGQRTELASAWAHGLCIALFFAIPASVLLASLGEPIVVSLFERGAFDAISVRETARALLWQGSAIWTVAAVRQTIPALYALGDTRTPVVVSALDLMAFIGLALGLRPSLGHVGISAAVAGSSAVQMLLLLVGLKWRLGTICLRTLTMSALRTLAASLFAGLAGRAAVHALAQCVAGSPSLRALPGLGAIGGFMVVFLAAMWALRAPEFVEISGAVRRRGRRRR